MGRTAEPSQHFKLILQLPPRRAVSQLQLQLPYLNPTLPQSYPSSTLPQPKPNPSLPQRYPFPTHSFAKPYPTLPLCYPTIPSFYPTIPCSTPAYQLYHTLPYPVPTLCAIMKWQINSLARTVECQVRSDKAPGTVPGPGTGTRTTTKTTKEFSNKCGCLFLHL